MDNLTNISNYLGDYKLGVDYKKFDFVFNQADGLYYYAKNDVSFLDSYGVSDSHRFVLDPNGPNWVGRETFYLYDTFNEIQDNFKPYQTISISGSTQGGDGDYLILSITPNYKPNDIVDGDYNIADVLGATEFEDYQNWFYSSWFLLGSTAFSWSGRDFNGYVDRYHDVRLSWKWEELGGNPSGLTRYQWGKQHYDNEGKAAGRSVPLTENANWIYHSLFGWIYISVRGRQRLLDEQNEAVWFFLGAKIGGGGDNVWFFANENWTNGNTAVLYYEETEKFDQSGESYYKLGQKSGYVFVQKSGDFNSSISGGDFDMYSIDQDRWFVVKNGVIYEEGIARPDPVIDIDYLNGEIYTLNQNSNFGSRLWLRGKTDSDSIDVYEDKSSHSITLLSKDIVPTLDSDDWSSDVFFFDADYGSTVSFKCENYKYEYGDGYYIYQPVGINSLKVEADLVFNNITNREASAIIHFVESHLGQYDKERSSPNLKYSQGIKGFKWGGDSTFHPYDNIHVQAKDFYCMEYSHDLGLNNNNKVSVKLLNLDTSLLDKSEGLYVGGAQVYSDGVTFSKNDIVLFEENQKYYYCINDNGSSALPPVQSRESWSREGGFFEDINKNIWTRDFVWKPSVGLKVSQRPRMKMQNLDQSYTQIHRDGLNEKLLRLDLEFNNRSDDEARAILHFLEQHYGCVPFRFLAPSPYDKERNFVCQSWSHTYQYKNNHSIKATFEEFPFNLPAEKYDAIVTQPTLRESQFVVNSVEKFDDQGEQISFRNMFRKRVFFKNSGDKPLIITNVRISNSDLPLHIVGKIDNNVPVIMEDLQYNYNIQLQSDLSELGYADQSVRMSKQFSEGPAGGIVFNALDDFGNKIISQGKPLCFLQNNLGYMKNLVTGQSVQLIGFSNTEFIKNHTEINPSDRTYQTVNPGVRGYVDVFYTGWLDENQFIEDISGINGSTTVRLNSKVFTGELMFEVAQSDASSLSDVDIFSVNLEIELYRIGASNV